MSEDKRNYSAVPSGGGKAHEQRAADALVRIEKILGEIKTELKEMHEAMKKRS